MIDKGITVNANGKKIEFTSLTNTSNSGFLIQTANQVNFNNMNLVTNQRGIAISAQEHNLNIKDSYILGINNEAGVSEGFANIVLYNVGCDVNVENTEFVNYENSVVLANKNIVQYIF